MKIAMSTKTKGTDFERVHIPEGIYDGVLKEVKDISDGTYGARVALIYEILGKQVSLAYVCYKTKATTENKIGQALIAHGVEISDKEIDTDNLPKRQVKIWVEDFELEKDGKKITASTISKVKPLVETQKV